jgi:hypothetical protein
VELRRYFSGLQLLLTVKIAFLFGQCHPKNSVGPLRVELRLKALPVLEECTFPLSLDFRYPFHCLDCCLHEVTVVSNRYISPFLKVDCRVLKQSGSVSSITMGMGWLHDCHFFAGGFPESLRPPNFTRVSLHPIEKSLGWRLSTHMSKIYLKFL